MCGCLRWGRTDARSGSELHVVVQRWDSMNKWKKSSGSWLWDVFSRLLGRSGVLITQKHYAPWVLERQQRLATSVRTAWSTMGLNSAAPIVNIADGRAGRGESRAGRS